MTPNPKGGAGLLVVAASAIRRSGLETVLRQSSVVRPIGSVSSLTSLASHLRQIQPDIILVDLDEEDPRFLTAFRTLPPNSAAIIVLVDEPEARWVASALRSGVRAIIPRESSLEEIEAAVRSVHLGLVLLDQEVSTELASHIRPSSEEPTRQLMGELTAREVEVLRMLAEGLGNREIGGRLGISEHTIKFHISSILGKTGAATRTEAVTLGIRLGLITL
jgi:NarL family two-component system response regulator YdfI